MSAQMDTGPARGKMVKSKFRSMLDRISQNAVERLGLPLLVFVLLLGGWSALQRDFDIRANHDSQVYLGMAEDPSHFTEAPFGFRIITPAAAHLFPDPRLGFAAVSLAALTLAAMAFYFYLEESLGRRAGLAGLAMFLSSAACREILINTIQVDAGLFLAMALSLPLMRHRRWYILAGLLSLAVFQKEAVLLLLLPVAAWFLLSGEKRRAAPATVLLFPLAAYALLHFSPLLYGYVPRSYTYFSLQNIALVSSYERHWGHPAMVLASSFVRCFGPCWILLPFALRRAEGLQKCLALLLVPVFWSMLFVTDWVRLLAMAFPAVIPPVCALRFRSGTLALFLLSMVALTYVLPELAFGKATKASLTLLFLSVGIAAGMDALRRSGWGAASG
jgi:hypothetical protein